MWEGKAQCEVASIRQWHARSNCNPVETSGASEGAGRQMSWLARIYYARSKLISRQWPSSISQETYCNGLDDVSSPLLFCTTPSVMIQLFKLDVDRL